MQSYSRNQLRLLGVRNRWRYNDWCRELDEKLKTPLTFDDDIATQIKYTGCAVLSPGWEIVGRSRASQVTCDYNGILLKGSRANLVIDLAYANEFTFSIIMLADTPNERSIQLIELVARRLGKVNCLVAALVGQKDRLREPFPTLSDPAWGWLCLQVTYSLTEKDSELRDEFEIWHGSDDVHSYHLDPYTTNHSHFDDRNENVPTVTSIDETYEVNTEEEYERILSDVAYVNDDIVLIMDKQMKVAFMKSTDGRPQVSRFGKGYRVLGIGGQLSSSVVDNGECSEIMAVLAGHVIRPVMSLQHLICIPSEVPNRRTRSTDPVVKSRLVSLVRLTAENGVIISGENRGIIDIFQRHLNAVCFGEECEVFLKNDLSIKNPNSAYNRWNKLKVFKSQDQDDLYNAYRERYVLVETFIYNSVQKYEKILYLEKENLSAFKALDAARGDVKFVNRSEEDENEEKEWRVLR